MDPIPSEMRLLGIFPFSGGWAVGADALPGFELAIEEINANPDMLPNTTLVGAYEDDGCSKRGGVLAPMTQCGPLSSHSPCTEAGNYFDVIIGSGCSVSCEATARLAEVWEVPQISWGCSSPSLSVTANFPWFVRAVWRWTRRRTPSCRRVLSDRIFIDAILSVFEQNGWDHMVVISENSGLFLGVVYCVR